MAQWVATHCGCEAETRENWVARASERIISSDEEKI